MWTTYAAIQGLTTAMERTGSVEPEDLVKDLKANPVETVMGTLSWQPNGDLKGFEFGVFEWHKDGTSTSVK